MAIRSLASGRCPNCTDTGAFACPLAPQLSPPKIKYHKIKKGTSCSGRRWCWSCSISGSWRTARRGAPGASLRLLANGTRRHGASRSRCELAFFLFTKYRTERADGERRGRRAELGQCPNGAHRAETSPTPPLPLALGGSPSACAETACDEKKLKIDPRRGASRPRWSSRRRSCRWCVLYSYGLWPV